jgi:hypothetical protein
MLPPPPVLAPPDGAADALALALGGGGLGLALGGGGLGLALGGGGLGLALGGGVGDEVLPPATPTALTAEMLVLI